LKVLLDENIPHDLRPFLRHHETFTAAYMGWAGLTNGQLLDAAEKEGFEVLVTGDLSLKYQQNMVARRIALVSLSAIGWPVIEPHVGKIIDAVDGAVPGSFVRVDVGKFRRSRGGAEGPTIS
jgi:hypothetical protein